MTKMTDTNRRNSWLRSIAQAAEAQLIHAVKAGKLTADDVASRALAAVRARMLHVFTHPKIQRGIEARMAGIYAGFAP